MVIVFVAITQLQRVRRDNYRKHVAGQLFVAVQNFYENNQRYPDPTDANEVRRFVQSYAPKAVDPSTGNSYTLQSLDPSIGPSDTIEYRDDSAPHTAIPPVGTVYIQFAHWCNIHGTYEGYTPPASDIISSDGGADTLRSKYVVWMGLESGSYYCIDNF